jgi:uncharacterized protein
MDNVILSKLAAELQVKPAQVAAAVQLLDDGATVPFIARYRKEATDGLDDGQLRQLAQRLVYLRELAQRREVILAQIEAQDKLTLELKQAILAAEDKVSLEDLYAPYKPKRHTKAQRAKEAGLQPLAKALFENPNLSPEQTAAAYLNAEQGFSDIKTVLEGARPILMEQFAEQAALVGQLRDYVWNNGVLASQVVAGKETEGAKFSDYFAQAEAIKAIPSHRALALFRGRNEGVLQLTLHENATSKDLPLDVTGVCEQQIARFLGLQDLGRAADKWLLDTVRRTWKVKLKTQLEAELLLRLRETAEVEAINVFGLNLKDLLLSAPAGAKATIGLDPGLRTGVKVAVVDDTGKLLQHGTIYPHAPRNQWDESIRTLAVLAQQYRVKLISIGNGTASRETERLAKDLIKRHPALALTSVVVSEAGASVYSASELAAHEFPDLDVSIRGAVSIARRLQDPLAELVKIDPKAIGVGQYQHDVNQSQLAKALDNVVEDCVNAVGVDVNMASAPLLTYVSGLNQGLANNIVAYREQNGAFKNRNALKKVPRLGAKTFEQAAGFLRIVNGDNPLDASAVHPEAYSVVQKMAQHYQKTLSALIGNSQFLQQITIKNFVNAQLGEPTLRDILNELDKPGRDPRPAFKTAVFKEGVENLSDLQTDMVLEGVVTNVTHFGAFVDIGVHQDGLVHISALADKFVSDPRSVVKAGDVVKVKVLSVDGTRKRIALTLRLSDDSRDFIPTDHPKPNKARKTTEPPPVNNAFAAAFAAARKR